MEKKRLAIILLAAIFFILVLLPRGKSSSYSTSAVSGMNTMSNVPVANPAPVPPPTAPPTDTMGISSAALIPREVVSTDDFGQYDPSVILSGQNYLDPRSQIGYPETLGGVLRNANRQYRSEPLNPRDPVSIFNLSTIPPDIMRPQFDINNDYQ